MLYQWDYVNGILQWSPLLPPTETDRQNASKYLLATSDVTDGAPNAVFSFAQIRSLVASAIFTKLLGAGEIELNNEYGGGGRIYSSNFVSGVSGWQITFDGKAEFNDITLRNNINAVGGNFNNINVTNGTFNAISVTSGVFDNITIGAGAILRGRINVGNLICDYDPSAMRVFGTYPAGTNFTNIMTEVFNWLGGLYTIEIFPEDGRYNNERIVRIVSGLAYNFIYTLNNTYSFIINGLTRYPLWFQMGSGEIKTRLVDLPLSAGGGQYGTLYRKFAGNGEFYVMVKAPDLG
jgi:hypothetical protein